MSEFEYASVIISIVLALGIAEILRFLADALRDPGARRIYWVHMLWVILLLELQVEFWWRMWAFKNQLAIGPGLALILIGPSILFMATRIILPRAGEDTDMARLYFQHKNAFFATMAASSLWSVAISLGALPEGQRGVLYLTLLLSAFTVSVFAACIVTSNRRFHSAVVLIFAAMELGEMFSWLLGGN